MPSPGAMGQLPVFKKFMEWFKNNDELKSDNFLFRMHHKFTTALLIFGLSFVFLENHLDGQAINCRGADSYAKSYCWIHGTGYVKQHLQGEATGCYVDQSTMTDNEWNGRVTAYYLWIPFLLTFCIGFSKLPRVLWKNKMEGNLMKKILDSDGSVIAQNFYELKKHYESYHLQFALCEVLNIGAVLMNMFMCDSLLVNKFWTYGVEVLDFLWSYQRYGHFHGEKTHNPMCELFPTEVACYITIGATTGGKDQNNYLCILSNNLFNQKYFLILWLWWVFLLAVSVLGMVYRVSRIVIPGLSKLLLLRKVERKSRRQLMNSQLTKSECFILDRISNLIPRKVFMIVIAEVQKRYDPEVELEESINIPNYIKKEMESHAKASAPLRPTTNTATLFGQQLLVGEAAFMGCNLVAHRGEGSESSDSDEEEEKTEAVEEEEECTDMYGKEIELEEDEGDDDDDDGVYPNVFSRRSMTPDNGNEGQQEEEEHQVGYGGFMELLNPEDEDEED